MFGVPRQARLKSSSDLISHNTMRQPAASHLPAVADLSFVLRLYGHMAIYINSWLYRSVLMSLNGSVYV